MNTELLIQEKVNKIETFQAGGTDEILKAIETEALSFVPDITTAKGRADIASVANNVAKSKMVIENAGKELVKVMKDKCKIIDAERKKSKDFCDDLKIRVRKPLTDYENLEKERVEKLEQRISEFRKDIDFKNSTEIKFFVEALEHIVIDDSWQEFKERAESQKFNELARLQKAYISVKKTEDDNAELEKFRQEKIKADQLAKEQEAERASIAQDEELARLAVSKEDEQQINQSLVDAGFNSLNKPLEIPPINLPKTSNESTEQKDLKRERARAINQAIIADLIKESGVSEKQAQNIIRAIIRGNITATAITY
jgi:hypothetical protein